MRPSGDPMRRRHSAGPAVEPNDTPLPSTSAESVAPTVVSGRFFMTAEAGRFLGLSPRTLEKHRVSGTGPVYRKLGGRVVYAVADLQEWADLGLRRSTSDKTATAISTAGGRRSNS